MSFFRTKNPWDPGYALPPNVNDETLGRGTIVTKGLRRKTFFVPKKLGSGGMVLPANVRAEPVGRGTITTKMIPRRTVAMKAPDTFADMPRPVVRGSLSGTSLSGTVFEKTTLGSSASGGSRMPDPFRDYGKKAAAWILVRLARVPREKRREALKALLDAVDPKLFATVEEKALKYREDLDASNKESLKLALEASLANGISTEIVELGKGKTTGPLMGLAGTSSIPLGATSTASTPVTIEVGGMRMNVNKVPFSGLKGVYYYSYSKTYRSPGGFQGLRLPAKLDAAFRAKLNEIANNKTLQALKLTSAVQTALMRGKYPIAKFSTPFGEHGIFLALDTGAFTDHIKSAVVTIKRMPPPDKNLLEKGVDFVKSAVSLPFKIVTEVPAAAIDLVQDGLDMLGELGCKVANSPLAPIAGATAGSVAGGQSGAQAGVVGAGVAQQMCGGGGGTVATTPETSWLPWAVAGGGALLLVLAVSS